MIGLVLALACEQPVVIIVDPPPDDSGPTEDSPDDSPVDTGPRTPPKILLFIGDGMGFQHVRGGGLYAHGAEGSLTMETLPYQGRLRTASFTGVTDSAAAGTVMSTGTKTLNGKIGLDPDNVAVQNVLELASLRGLSTGVVTRDRVTGATPATFLAHVESRSDDQDILLQILSNLPDVLMGGGNLVLDAAMANQVATEEELRAAIPDGRPLVGLFSQQEMPYVVDATTEPSLATMTTEALRFLQEDPEGFILVVEGARIDHASHARDSSRVHAETAAFDEAVAAGMAWAEGQEGVTIVVTADHECGGMEVSDDLSTTWRWGKHTNADIPVFSNQPVFDGARLDQLWVHSVLVGAIDGREPAAPEVPPLTDGWTEDLGEPVEVQLWESSFGAGYNQLDALRVASLRNALRIGIDGVFEWDRNAVLVLVDVDPGAGTGVTDINDTGGKMDMLLSGLNLELDEEGIGFEWAIGSVGALELGIDELSEYAGLRDLSDPTDLGWSEAIIAFDDGNIAKNGPARDAGAAGATEGGMELEIPWLGTPATEVAILVLLVNSDGSVVSNQALPPLADDQNPVGAVSVGLARVSLP